MCVKEDGEGVRVDKVKVVKRGDAMKWWSGRERSGRRGKMERRDRPSAPVLPNSLV